MEHKSPPMYQRIRHYVDDVACLSRKLVALNAGMSESKLSLMLAGKRRISVDEFEVLCKAMSVDPKRFYESASAERS